MGVGVGEETPGGGASSVNMMEVEDQDYADTGGSGVMVSNLPLLFSGGTPSSLYQMNQVRGREGEGVEAAGGRGSANWEKKKRRERGG